MQDSKQYSISGITDEPYRRVGGLMLLLCFFMVVANPIVETLKLLAMWSRAAAFRDDIRIQLLLVGASIITIGFTIFGLVAGLFLWRVHRAGRALVVSYFVAEIAVTLLVALVVEFLRYRQGMGGQAFGAMIPLIAPSLLRSGLWTFYLLTSKRVRRTYQLRHPKPEFG